VDHARGEPKPGSIVILFADAGIQRFYPLLQTEEPGLVS
jgi:hypothetical protein